MRALTCLHILGLSLAVAVSIGCEREEPAGGASSTPASPSDSLKQAAEEAPGAMESAKAMGADAQAWVSSMTAQVSQYQDKLPMLKDAAAKLNNPELSGLVSQIEPLIGLLSGKLESAKSAAMAGDLAKAKAEVQPLLDQLKPLMDKAMELATSAGLDAAKLPGLGQ